MMADKKIDEFSDETRLKRFLELLPEQWIEDYRYVASDGRYEGEYEDILKKYSYYANTIASHFLNKEIEDAYCKMNDSFFEMRKFMLPIFQIYMIDDKDSSLYRIGILPELRKSDSPEDNNRFINIFYKFFEYFDNFEISYKEFLHIAFKELNENSSNNIVIKQLKDCTIKFDDSTGKIHIDEIEVQLPPYKKEHIFTRVMFTHKKDEIIDWSIVHNEMTGEVDIPDREKWRYVYDASCDVNNRINNSINTDDKLFEFKEKTIKRLY